jgi:pyrroline-5-carboxylate reductase
MGLDKNLAIRLASQTMLGAASMVLEQLNEKEHGKHIMQMKEEVCSPGGTTINGIAQLEKYRVRSALINCIEEATKSTARLNMTN